MDPIARLLAQRYGFCNSRLVIAALIITTASAGAQPSAPAPPAQVSTLEITDLAALDTQTPEVRQRIAAALALTKLNLTYRFGSSEPAQGGMDCSGTIYHLLRALGHTDVPRQSDQIAQWVIDKGSWTPTQAPASLDDPVFAALKPGDLLFWGGTYASTQRTLPVTHVMLYLGKHRITQKPVVFGASDGRSYAGQRRTGVSVFDFALPKVDAKASFMGYGPPPAPPPAKKASK
jgi:cell wall-associated NlpC family hydrolase